jgi:hypothetical protein
MIELGTGEIDTLRREHKIKTINAMWIIYLKSLNREAGTCSHRTQNVSTLFRNCPFGTSENVSSSINILKAPNI